MTNPTIRIHDLTNDEVIDREMTNAEFTAYKADKAAQDLVDEKKAKAQADKAAIATRLGLSADELATLLS